MEQTSNKLLKVTGIIMIIFASIGIVMGIFALIAVLGSGLVVETIGEVIGEDVNMTSLKVAVVISLIGACVNLAAGILGVANASKPEKAQICIIFGALTIIFVLLNNILNFTVNDNLNVLNLGIGLVLPVLYITGAIQNKKLVTESFTEVD